MPRGSTARRTPRCSSRSACRRWWPALPHLRLRPHPHLERVPLRAAAVGPRHAHRAGGHEPGRLLGGRGTDWTLLAAIETCSSSPSSSSLLPAEPPAARRDLRYREALTCRRLKYAKSQAVRRLHGGEGCRPEGRGGRGRLPARPLGLRQDHDAAHDRRLESATSRRRHHRRPAHERPDAAEARHRHGVPVLCALPRLTRGPEHRHAAALRRSVQGRQDAASEGRRRSCTSTRCSTAAEPDLGGRKQRLAVPAPSCAIPTASSSTSPLAARRRAPPLCAARSRVLTAFQGNRHRHHDQLEASPWRTASPS